MQLGQGLAPRKWQNQDLNFKLQICCSVAAFSSVPYCGDEEFAVSNLFLISLNCWKAITDTELNSVSFLTDVKLPFGNSTECPFF